MGFFDDLKAKKYGARKNKDGEYDPNIWDRVDPKTHKPITYSPIMNAALVGDIDMVKLFIERGADLTYRTPDTGKTVIMVALEGIDAGTEEKKKSQDQKKIYIKYKEMIGLLIKAGADKNAIDNEGNSILAYGMLNHYDNTDTVTFLYEQGIEDLRQDKGLRRGGVDFPYFDDFRGKNQLYYNIEKGNFEKVRSLVFEYNADLNVKSEDGTMFELLSNYHNHCPSELLEEFVEKKEIDYYEGGEKRTFGRLYFAYSKESFYFEECIIFDPKHLYEKYHNIVMEELEKLENTVSKEEYKKVTTQLCNDVGHLFYKIVTNTDELSETHKKRCREILDKLKNNGVEYVMTFQDTAEYRRQESEKREQERLKEEERKKCEEQKRQEDARVLAEINAEYGSMENYSRWLKEHSARVARYRQEEARREELYRQARANGYLTPEAWERSERAREQQERDIYFNFYAPGMH